MEISKVELDQSVDALTAQLLGSQNYRKVIIGEILSVENQERKLSSYRQTEIYEDRLDLFVMEELLQQFSKSTVSQIPRVDFVNIQKKIVKKQATLYKCPPKRTLASISEKQIEDLKEFYEDNNWNDALQEANEAFKSQDQTTLWVAPIAGTLRPRILFNHMVDVIPHPEDPAIPLAYMISAFDRTLTRYTSGDGANATIADEDDAKLRNWKVLVWTKTANFVMNGLGELVSIPQPNPIGELPFIDISRRKNLRFFIDGGKSLERFTIKFNAAISDAWYVVKMQGWAIGWLKGPAEMVPEKLEVGPGKFIHLPTNEQTGDKLDIGFANPQADIQGTMSFLETLISLFLSSHGIDPKEVAMRLEGRSFSSGFERLLAMLEVFEATEGDMKIFGKVERKLFKLLNMWTAALAATDTEGLLPPTLRGIPEKVNIKAEFKRPELIQTEDEKINSISTKKEKGYISTKMAIKTIHNLNDEAAEQMIETIIRDEVEYKVLKSKIESELGAKAEPEGVKDEKTEPRQD